METSIQVLVSGLTLGSMYAVSTVSLTLVWGALRMLNMAQGALLTVGGYFAYTAATAVGLPPILGIPVTIVAGGLLGVLIYLGVVHHMLEKEGFEINVIIATIGIAIVLENLILTLYGAYPIRQPFSVDGGFFIGRIHVPYNNVAILLSSITLMIALAVLLGRTRLGRTIRAVSQNHTAAQLMGVPVRLVYAQVLMIAGGLAAVSGVMLSTITTLAPTMGYDPMLKAFIICVIAGLGNVMGALYAAFLLGLFEAFVQFFFGVRFAFPAMLLLVIVTLIWRPYGLFGRAQVSRL